MNDAIGHPSELAQQANPYSSDLALANSSYAAYSDNALHRPLDGRAPVPLATEVHQAFRSWVLGGSFTCVGAAAAVRRGHYRMGLYADMGSPGATAGLAHDLFAFEREQDTFHSDFTTFVATFSTANESSEIEFEQTFWSQLQHLHDLDTRVHPWDATVSDDTDDPRFSFSFGGRAFFVIGLHPRSSRLSRRFPWPSMVFNAHRQFVALKRKGTFERIQRVVRLREMELQGSLNPNLSDFSDSSEARQYSGREVEAVWSCPLAVHRADRSDGAAR